MTVSTMFEAENVVRKYFDTFNRHNLDVLLRVTKNTSQFYAVVVAVFNMTQYLVKFQYTSKALDELVKTLKTERTRSVSLSQPSVASF